MISRKKFVLYYTKSSATKYLILCLILVKVDHILRRKHFLFFFF